MENEKTPLTPLSDAEWDRFWSQGDLDEEEWMRQQGHYSALAERYRVLAYSMYGYCRVLEREREKAREQLVKIAKHPESGNDRHDMAAMRGLAASIFISQDDDHGIE